MEKIFVVNANSYVDGNDRTETYAFKDRTSAQLKYSSLCNEFIDSVSNVIDEYSCERDENNFALWLDGYYEQDHMTCEIKEIELR